MSHASLPARLERGSCTRCRDCWSRRSASIRRHGQDSRALVWAKWCVLLKDWFGCGGNQVATQARLRELISKVRGAARIVHSLGGGTIPGIKLTDCIGVLMVVCRSGGPRFTVGQLSFVNCFAEVQSDATADQCWGKNDGAKKAERRFSSRFAYLRAGHGQTGSAASKVFAWHASHNSSLGGISLHMVIVGGGFVVADLIRIYTSG